MRVVIFTSCIVTLACTALAEIPDEIKLRLQQPHTITNSEFLSLVTFDRGTAASNDGITKLRGWMGARRGTPVSSGGPEFGNEPGFNGGRPGLVPIGRPGPLGPPGPPGPPGTNGAGPIGPRPTRRPTVHVARQGASVSTGEVFEGDTGVLTAEAKEALIEKIPEAPLCEPRPTTVDVPLAADPSYFYWPSCVSIDLCGGCCSQGQGCVPKRTETVTLPMYKVRYSEDGGIDYQDIVQMNFEKHVACTCDCPVKEGNCDLEIHDYVQTECRCKCKNEDEQFSQCSASGKTWDDKTCTCGCPVKLECATSEIFSMETCRCEPMRRNFAAARNTALGTENGPETEEVPPTATTAAAPTTASAPLTWAQRKRKCRQEMTCPRGRFGFPTRNSAARKPCYCKVIRRNTRTRAVNVPAL